MRFLANGFVLLAAAAALAACTDTSSRAPAPEPMPAPPMAAAPGEPAMRTGAPADEQACELAVTRETNNPDIMTLSSEFSEANTEVIIGVGPDRARWRCLVSKGVVAEVMSLTDEGAL